MCFVYQFLIHDTQFKDRPLDILFQFLCYISCQNQYNLQCCDRIHYRTGPWDILLTTSTAVKLAGIKPWIHHTQVKKAPEQGTRWTARRPESHLSRTMTYVLFITFCSTPCCGQLIPFKQDENIWVYLAKKCSNHFWLLSCRRNLCWTSFHFMSCRCLYSLRKPAKLHCVWAYQ